jgi:hypothetical protein
MNHKLSRIFLLLGIGLSVVVSSVGKSSVLEQVPAASRTAEEPSPRPYSKNLEELRARFNKDRGKVRLVTLLSPT